MVQWIEQAAALDTDKEIVGMVPRNLVVYLRGHSNTSLVRVGHLSDVKATYFRSTAEFRRWLEKDHAKKDELLVGYHKKATGKPSMTWAESVDEALCFGWIDGIRRRVDDERYTIRFTPRRKGSNWSLTNIRRVKQLKKEGLMKPAGLQAFEARRDDRSAVYSYEQRQAAKLDEADERIFRRAKTAWAFFESAPPSYRKAAIHWVMSAKREETRKRRLETLIECSAKEQRVPPLTPPGARQSGSKGTDSP
jgi:uncharacterized protein YdeI (YjbR/CyaY-like superfamily)